VKNIAKIDQIIHDIRNNDSQVLRNKAIKNLHNAPLFDIEVSSICNISCIYCPRSKIKRKAKLMEPSVFANLVKLLPNNAIVMFAGLGEPLLNFHLEKYIKILKKHDISSCIVTNGVLLDLQRQKSLIASGIDEIQISYQSTIPSIINLLTNNTLNLEMLNDNLSDLSAHKSTHKSTQLRVQLNYVLMKENKKELLKVKTLASKLGFNFYLRRLHTRGGNLCAQKKHIRSTCGILAAVTFISSDGLVLSCANTAQEKIQFKNVQDITWNEIIDWKTKLLNQELEHKCCLSCNDDYRWLIIEDSTIDI
jgi:organic radical activating enzyme